MDSASGYASVCVCVRVSSFFFFFFSSLFFEVGCVGLKFALLSLTLLCRLRISLGRVSLYFLLCSVLKKKCVQKKIDFFDSTAMWPFVASFVGIMLIGDHYLSSMSFTKKGHLEKFPDSRLGKEMAGGAEHFRKKREEHEAHHKAEMTGIHHHDEHAEGDHGAAAAHH